MKLSVASATSVMPKYDLPETDLEALSEFLLALDFGKQPMRIVQRGEILDNRSNVKNPASSLQCEAQAER